MSILIFKAWFFVTLLPGAAILLFQLNHFVHYLLYLGTAQVLVLGILGTRLPLGYMPMAIETLHKAGFLHTLFAMGAALVVSGDIISAGIYSPEALSKILMTMGAAILPHAIAVMVSQGFQMQHFHPDGERMEAMEGLTTLYEQRKRVLQQVIEALQEETGMHENIKIHLKDQDEALTGLKESLAILQANFEETLSRLTEKTDKAFGGLEATLKTLRENMTETKVQMDGTKEAAQGLKSASDQAAKSLAGLRDMEKLLGLFEELINAEIFRRAS